MVDPAAEDSRRPRLPWLGMACIALLAVGGAVVLRIATAEEPQEKWCAGVGVVTRVWSSSPESAFRGWLDSNRGQPREQHWSREGDTSYRNRTYDDSGGYGYKSVQVSNFDPERGRLDRNKWSVTGACV